MRPWKAGSTPAAALTRTSRLWRRPSARWTPAGRSQAQIDAYRKKEQGRAKWLADYRQWEKYRLTIPDKTPKTFETFLRHKRAGDAKYKSWMAEYRAANRVEKGAKSGIIEANMPKEIPGMGKVSGSTPKDVAADYLKTATPGSHTVRDLHNYAVDGVTYTVNGHNVVLDYSPHEKEIAELLERTLGGEIFMVPRVNEPQGVSTPDYLFRGKRFDLKSPRGRGKNTLYDAIAKKAAQADNFIFDLTQCPLNDEEISRQIALIYKSTHTKFVDIIIVVKHGTITRIVQREKKQS